MDTDDDARCRATMHASKAGGIVLVTLSAIGWSMAGLLIRLVSTGAWEIVGWRGVLGAAFVGLYLIMRQGAEVPRTLARLGWAGWLVATLTTLSSVSYVGALQAGPIADAVVIYATSPFVTAGIAWLVLRERPARSTMLASALAFIGIAIVVGGRQSHSSLVGMLLTCLATVTMGLVTVLSRKFRNVSMVPVTCISSVQLGIVGSVGVPLGSVSDHDLAILAVLAFVLSASLACYVEGARRIVASEAALLSTLDVPLVPLWVWLLLDEAPGAATMAGACIVMAAVLYDIRRPPSA